MRNFQAKLDKIEKVLGKDEPFRQSPIIRIMRMIVESTGPRAPRRYVPKKEDKVGREEWKDNCEREFRYQKLHFGEEARKHMAKTLAVFEKDITRLKAWRD